ncbi:hypothetical protein BC739_002267 [Kutzneria viridogrisea]|uniref:VCBS repeat-containing protein n=1 Tax=Kutzneria viridogrisea TaxID=47990 RepID=A0ABR6BDV8_9PSEU|nr:hypothetical protein [Kutzneria viridogrisea]
MRAIVPVLAAVSAALAFAVPANAGTAPILVHADLDGDGVADEVTLTPVADNAHEQLLTATVRGIQLTARVPFDSLFGLAPLRVVDLNGDGKQEVVVTESVGANTDGFSVWGLHGGLRPVTSGGADRFKLWEGGGFSAISGYGCEPAGGTRQLVTVSAELTDWQNEVYEGDRVTYSVRDGVATETSRTHVVGARGEAGFRTDARTCA